ncbi:MAG TPA: PAS domain S-box protein, partial [Gemmatimonadales bacterium]|nr:PAS domain S-box protein [Gemmatimonadales bacterium]
MAKSPPRSASSHGTRITAAEVAAAARQNHAEQRLRDIIEHSTNLFYTHTADHVLTYVSPQTRQFFDCEPAEALIRWTEFLTDNPINAEGLRLTELAIKTGKPQPPYELELRGMKGRVIRVEVHEAPVVENGKTVAIVGSLTDVTARKAAEESARRAWQRREELELIINKSPAVAFLWRAAPGWPVEYVTSNCMQFGYEMDELTKVPYASLLHPDDLGRIAEEVTRYTAEGRAEFEQEYRIRTKRGDYRWLDDHTWVRREPDGTVTHYQGIVIDITARKQVETERERLMTAIEQADECVVVTDADGAIEYVNPAFEAVTGYTRAEVMGQNPRILKSGKQDAAFYRSLWDTLTSGKSWKGRFVNRRKDGSLYTDEGVISPVHDQSGRITNYVSVKHDITEQLQLTAQLHQSQKMESMGRLAGGVAHDYNNMIGVILGFAELALTRLEPSDPLYGDLKEIQSAARRSADITRQLLAFARRQPVAPIVLDLTETVEGMLKLLRRLIGEDIELLWKPSNEPLAVRIDPGQVDQILANLCVNSRDAIAGVGKITIETGRAILDEVYCAGHPGFVPGDFATLAVSDTGAGMDHATKERIFEPFFTTKELGRGTGLGLSTVYGIVKQNDGFINVYSEPGAGTTIRIYLPRVATGVPEPAAAPLPEPPRSRGETVLVAEDEKSIRELTVRVLERLGYRVLAA